MRYPKTDARDNRRAGVHIFLPQSTGRIRISFVFDLLQYSFLRLFYRYFTGDFSVTVIMYFAKSFVLVVTNKLFFCIIQKYFDARMRIPLSLQSRGEAQSAFLSLQLRSHALRHRSPLLIRVVWRSGVSYFKLSTASQPYSQSGNDTVIRGAVYAAAEIIATVSDDARVIITAIVRRAQPPPTVAKVICALIHVCACCSAVVTRLHSSSSIIIAIIDIESICAVRYFLLTEQEHLVLRIRASVLIVSEVKYRRIVIRIGASCAVVYRRYLYQRLLQARERRCVERFVQPSTNFTVCIVFTI